MPLVGPWFAAGVAAGVAGVTPLPLAACAPIAPLTAALLSLFAVDVGGVSSPAAPGKDREPGAVKAFA